MLVGSFRSRLAMKLPVNRAHFVSRTVATKRVATKASEYDYDIFTIGAGSGGVRGSRFATSYGAKVAVCELPLEFVSSDEAGGVGGTCVLRGCVPKKLMVYASEHSDHFDGSVGFGWEEMASKPKFNMANFLAAKRTELNRLNGAYKNTLKNANVEFIEGRGKVTGPHEVEVDGKKYTAANILIAVGGKPAKLDIPGKELCITSDEVLELGELPKRMVVLGAGYIAVEFSCIFHRLGSEVHTVYRAPLPLRGFDMDCRSFLADQYKAAGMNLHPEHTPVSVSKQADGKLSLIIKDKDGKEAVMDNLDSVVMATGRSPKTSGLGLEEVGVKLGKKGEVLVDEYSRTNIPSIWAVGDVTDRINLTPVALMEGMALAKTIVLNEPTKPDYNAVASAVFSNPELATVGLSEEDAIKAGHKDLDIFTSSFRPMKNTISGSPLRSFMKMVVDANTDKVLGIHMVGDHAAEIMQGFAVAVKMGATKAQVDSVVGIHPSSAEELVTMRSPSRKVRGGVAA